MVLTIGMIVKNEEKYLESCLKSLDKIRFEISSELIIVDTGSTDKTVEIAKKYTDDVRFFEWCNDFSAARNFSMKGARGEWFMCIDADESFGDSDDLIQFFKSGEYKNFNSATYTIRNHSSLSGKNYSDLHAARLTKILPNTKYQNAIHEHLNTYGERIKHLESFVDHYGYYYESDESYNAKMKRNYDLLLGELKIKPSAKVYKELCDTLLKEKNDDLLDYAAKGIKLAIKEGDYYLCFFIALRKIIYLSFRAVEDSKEYLSLFKKSIRDYQRLRDEYKNKLRSDIIASDIDVYGFSVVAEKLGENDDGVIKAFIKYNELYHELKNGKHRTQDYYRFTFNYTDRNIFPLTHSLHSFLVLDKIEESLKYADEYDFSEYYFFPSLIKSRLKYELNLSIKTNNNDRIMAIITLLDEPLTEHYDLIFIILSKHLDINLFSEKVDLSKLSEYFINSDYKIYYAAAITDYLNFRDKSTLSEKSLHLLIKLSENIFAFTNDFDDSLMKAYSVYGRDYLIKNEKEPFVHHESDFSDEDKFLYHIINACRYKDTMQKSAYLKSLSAALKAMPSMKNLIEMAINLGESIEQPNEFTELSNNIKELVLFDIKNNNLEKARKTLLSYEEINPNDEDIIFLKNFL